MRVRRFYIARHGQTDWNAEGRWQGFEPTSLNVVGHKQAAALAVKLSEFPIGAIYTSDLPRSSETAQHLADTLNLEPYVDARLREINVGAFQGMLTEDMEKAFPEAYARWRTGGLDVAPPRGETRRQLQDRVFSAFEDILRVETEPEVAIFTHGGTIRLLLQKICQTDPLFEYEMKVPNASYTVLEPCERGWCIRELTQSAHLNGLTE